MVPMRRFASVMVVVVLLSGCFEKDPLDAAIPADSQHYEVNLKPHADKLSAEDQATLAAYLERKKLPSGRGLTSVPAGTTIRQAIADQKAWQAKSKPVL